MATKEVRIFKDAEGLSEFAAEMFIELCNNAVSVKNRFSVALSGGTTPRRLYELLSGDKFKDKVDWSKIHIFFGDERFVPSDDPQSNFRMTRETLLSKVPIPIDNIHAIATESISPEEAAKKYSTEMELFFNNKLPVFDLILLGVGSDGHVASLFPGSTVDTKVIRKSMAVITNAPKPPSTRLSLTLEAINSSLNVIMLVAGKDKADVVRKVINDKTQEKLVLATQIKPQKSITWILDKAAAEFV